MTVPQRQPQIGDPAITCTLVCDICGTGASYEDTPPSGWVSLPTANWIKRVWQIDNHVNPNLKFDVCPTCVEKGRRP